MKKILIRLVLIGVLLAVAIAALTVFWVKQPIFTDNTKTMVFTIDAGSSMRRAANKIAEDGVPVNPTLLWLLARISGKASQIQAGSYELTSGITPSQLINKMVSGDVMKVSITIIEGWTFKQMREAINTYPSIKHDTAQLGDQELMARIAPAYSHPEGLFFPETYVFSPGTSDLAIYRKAFALMQFHLNNAWDKRNPELPYNTPYDALIMASIIEKETGLALERDMIASVFVNRLRIGMRLQTDPSVIYGMGEDYQGNIRRKDLTTDTPYNTYTRAGLPPTPIALAGLASMHAAFNPANSTSLYFVSRGDGTSHFSPTLQEHNQAVDKYIRKQFTPAPVVPKAVTPAKKATAKAAAAKAKSAKKQGSAHVRKNKPAAKSHGNRKESR